MAITADELARFEALQDADEYIGTGETETPTFDWGEDYQRSVLAMLVADRVFLMQSINLVKPAYFTSKIHQKIAEILFAHFKEYRTPPSAVIFRKQIKESVKDDDNRLAFEAELLEIFDAYEPGIDSREFAQNEIYTFSKVVALKSAFHRSLNELRKKPDDNVTWNRIDRWLNEARTLDFKFDIGIEYFGTVRERYGNLAAEREALESFSTGFKPIDDEMTHLGMRRGEIYAFMGPPGVGKSLCLIRLACANILEKKKVLFITLEMTSQDVAGRFDAQLADVSIRHLIENEKTVAKSLCEITSDLDDKRLLIIKQFPSGTANTNTFRGFAAQLQQIGWTPDVVCCDYLGEMGLHPHLKIYESREETIKELRAFGTETGCVIATAIQPNRSAREALDGGGVINSSSIASSIGILNPLDGLFTINQTENEKRGGCVRISVEKLRGGKSGWVSFCSVDPQTLKFEPISEQKYRLKMSQVTEQAASSVAIDELKIGDVVGNRRKTPYKPSNPE